MGPVLEWVGHWGEGVRSGSSPGQPLWILLFWPRQSPSSPLPSPSVCGRVPSDLPGRAGATWMDTLL